MSDRNRTAPDQSSQDEVSTRGLPAKPWSLDGRKVLDELSASQDAGLSSEEAEARQRHYGPNRLRRARSRPAWAILLDQCKSLIVLILSGAAILAFAFGETPEGVALVAVVFVNAGIGFVSEWRAVRSMQALRRMEEPEARVRRDGREQVVAAASLVPGDILLLEGGAVVPADVRLLKTQQLRAMEAALTGESVPANKRETTLEANVPLAERANMLYRGTTLARGSAEGVVTATGMQTELGQISELAESAGETEAPLQRRLDELGKRFAYLVLGSAVLIAGGGLLVGQPTLLMIKTAIALGLAAIPEGAPIVATIALARGMWLMSRRQALVNRLTAVETLGSTQVIFSDKTGTLTQNRMILRKVFGLARNVELPSSDEVEGESAGAGNLLEEHPWMHRILEVGVLCNDANLGTSRSQSEAEGDPMEIALLRAGQRFGLSRDDLQHEKPRQRDVPFDPEVMMMATVQETDEGLEVTVKGAPGRVLECSRFRSEENGSGRRELDDAEREECLQQVANAAKQGLRLLAMADKRVQDAKEDPYTDLRFLGFVGLADPPAEGVREAIQLCDTAGIRVNMVTGDQPETAHAIGRQVGMVDNGEDLVLSGRDLESPDDLDAPGRERILASRIFARVSPKQKLDLIRIFQEDGRIVAMTGDGVNDTPALKKANIGIAMGRRGTEAARQAADMVLKDDAFSSIAAAVEQGRIIFRNIRRSVLFMLCTNGAEVLIVAAATLAGAPLPLRPLQILFLNVITDVFPALALGVGKGSPAVMKVPPRDPRESIIGQREWRAIAGWSVILGASVLGAFTLGLQWLDLPEPAAVTVSFLTLGFGKLWFVLNLRDRASRLFHNDIVRNPWVWGALALCIAALFAALHLPGLSDVLQTEPPQLRAWGIVLGFSLVPTVIGQVIMACHRR